MFSCSAVELIREARFQFVDNEYDVRLGYGNKNPENQHKVRFKFIDQTEEIRRQYAANSWDLSSPLAPPSASDWRRTPAIANASSAPPSPPIHNPPAPPIASEIGGSSWNPSSPLVSPMASGCCRTPALVNASSALPPLQTHNLPAPPFASEIGDSSRDLSSPLTPPLALDWCRTPVLVNASSALPPLQIHDPPASPISSEIDAFFQDRYRHTVGPWFDLFDTAHHFSCLVPHVALSHLLLFQSGLACAAKQHYLTSTQCFAAALAYYSAARRTLPACLTNASLSSSPAVFASCLLLAYCEMIDASSQDWHLHLSDATALVSAHGWNGKSDCLAQACFWIYCRMDILSSLATGVQTSLSPHAWPPPAALFTGDDWCNATLHLLAEVHNLLCDVRLPHASVATLSASWVDLLSRLASHAQAQPAHLRAVAVSAPPSGSPLRRVMYVSPASAAGQQLFSLACLLHILCFPTRSRAARREHYVVHADDAARLVDDIIANSIADSRDCCRANAVQPLTSAGMALVGDDKRAALVELLLSIGKRTGWRTRGNVEILRSWWQHGYENQEAILMRVFEDGASIGVAARS